MGSNIQLGALAACIVVLVPMALAGYHLSRNKMLFFGGFLFISLAIAVHLSPYFPSLPDLFPSSSLSSSHLPLFPSRLSCLPLLTHIQFNHSVPVSGSGFKSWNWVDTQKGVHDCEFQKLGRADSRVLLNGSWVLVAGDSQARLFVLSLLELVLDEGDLGPIRADLFKRHSDYHLLVESFGLRLDFVWAPFVGNLSDLVMDLNRNGTSPDVVVMGSGLWHMLHVSNAVDYGVVLRDLGSYVVSLLMPSSDFGSGLGRAPPHLFWLGMPMLVNSMLNAEEKRVKMSNVSQFEYEQGVRSSKLLRPGGPFVLLDVRDLSVRCGVGCTEDGMHYGRVVYDAAVHVMLNALLIQSQQKL